MHVVRGQKAPGREIVRGLAVAAYVRRQLKQAAELGCAELVEAQFANRILRCEAAHGLVGLDRKPDRLHEVVGVGLGAAALVQPVDREADGDVPIDDALRLEQSADGFEAVLDRELTRGALIQLAEGRPPPAGCEMVRHHLLVEPPRIGEREVHVQRRLQEGDQRPVELLDEWEGTDLGDLDLAVEAEPWIGLRRAADVGERLDEHGIAVVA